MKKKIALGVFILLIVSWLVWAKSYTFNVEKATAHLTVHGRNHSRGWCAWYTMRALQVGGCPAILLPAQWYSWFMPVVGFKEICKNDYKPQAGDVVVFQKPKEWKGHLWGHIAMYNGEQWISDFKQRRMSPYANPKWKIPYKVFRFKRRK